jgi:hypothetical protein
MSGAKGCLTVLLGLILIGLVVNLLQQTWPVCVPTAVVIVAWLLTLKSSNPIKLAIHGVLGPMTVGLLLVCSLTLLFNVMSPSANEVNLAERALVYADNSAPAVTKLSALRFSLAMIFLTSVAYFFPRLQTVTRFFLIKKWAGRVSATLTAATTFTFFTNAAVVQPKVPDVYLKIDALYRRSKEGQAKAVDRYLAAKAVQRALSNLQSGEREFCEFLLESIAAVPTMDIAAKKELVRYTSMGLHQEGGLLIDAEHATVAVSAHPHGEALKALNEQLQMDKAAERFADEGEKAAQESLNLVNDQLKELGWSFVDRLIGDQASEISRLAKPFVDKILDSRFESYTEPIVKQQAERVRRFFQHPEAGTEARTLANKKTQSDIVLMSIDEAKLADKAARQALESARQAQKDAQIGNDGEASADMIEAQRASTQSMEDANFAKSAANSIRNFERVSLSGSDQIGIAVAIDAADVARSLRAAVEVEEAIKTAKTALQLVEDARAVKNAAEAAKTLLRVIPK